MSDGVEEGGDRVEESKIRKAAAKSPLSLRMKKRRGRKGLRSKTSCVRPSAYASLGTDFDPLLHRTDDTLSDDVLLEASRPGRTKRSNTISKRKAPFLSLDEVSKMKRRRASTSSHASDRLLTLCDPDTPLKFPEIIQCILEIQQQTRRHHSRSMVFNSSTLPSLHKRRGSGTDSPTPSPRNHPSDVFYQCYSKHGISPIHSLVQRVPINEKCYRMFSTLIHRLRLDLNQLTKMHIHKNTVVHILASRDKDTLPGDDEAKGWCEKVMALFLAYGVDVNATNAMGETALAIATKDKSTFMIGLLLKYGAHATAESGELNDLELYDRTDRELKQSRRLRSASFLLRTYYYDSLLDLANASTGSSDTDPISISPSSSPPFEKTAIKNAKNEDVSGYLHIYSAKRTKWKVRWCVLQGSTLVWWRSPGDVDTETPGAKINIPKATFGMLKDSERAHTYFISTPKKRYLLSASSATEATLWVDSFSKIKAFTKPFLPKLKKYSSAVSSNMEGMLYVLEGKKTWKRSWIEVFDGIFTVHVKKGGKLSGKPLDLLLYSINELEIVAGREYCFALVGEMEMVWLAADNEAEMKEWVTNLRETIASTRETAITLSSRNLKYDRPRSKSKSNRSKRKDNNKNLSPKPASAKARSTSTDSEAISSLSGWLKKRGKHRWTSSWVKHWCIIRNQQLVYSRTKNGTASDSSVGASGGESDIEESAENSKETADQEFSIELLFAIAKPLSPSQLPNFKLKLNFNLKKDMHLFEVLTAKDTHLFAAPTEQERDEWVFAIVQLNQQLMKTHLCATLRGRKQSIHSLMESYGSYQDLDALDQSESALKDLKKRGRIVVQQIAREEGNNRCADCGAEEPEWASINIGVFLCIECAGVHRSLGTHISQVRSIDLDLWDPEVVAAMQSKGNLVVNEEIGEVLDGAGQVLSISKGSAIEQRCAYIEAKYVKERSTQEETGD